MLTYDVECPVTFADDVPPDRQVLLRKAIGTHLGFPSAPPVLRWPSPREALVLFVLRDLDGSGAEELCQKAVGQVRDWLATSGLATESGPEPAVECVATPRG